MTQHVRDVLRGTVAAVMRGSHMAQLQVGLHVELMQLSKDISGVDDAIVTQPEPSGAPEQRSPECASPLLAEVSL